MILQRYEFPFSHQNIKRKKNSKSTWQQYHFGLGCDSQMFYKEINSLSPRDKIAEFANSVYLEEMAHEEPPHLDLHFLLSSLRILNII